MLLLCELRANEGKGCLKYQNEAVKQSGSDLGLRVWLPRKRGVGSVIEATAAMRLKPANRIDTSLGGPE